MLHLTKCLIVFIFLFISVNLMGQFYFGKEKDIQKILDNTASFSQHYMNSEPAKIAACYTIDGKIFPGKSKIIEGLEDIEKRWTIPEDVKILKHKVTPSEIRIVKKYAYDYGYYEGETLKANGETVPWQGKYVIVWKKVDKDWKIYLDIWNTVDPE